MPRISQPSPRRRRPLLWVLLTVIVTGLIGLSAVASGYVLYLDKTVRTQFEGKRWAIPARVYARPLELFKGMPLSPAQLTAELVDLGYRRTADLDTPGTYSDSKNELRFVTRAFRYWDKAEGSLSISAHFDKGQVSDLQDVKHHTALDLVRLDPVLIGSIYPAEIEDRVLVKLQDVPPLLIKMLVDVEDHRFYQHHGIDPVSIGRALWSDMRAGASVQGGSTLTQQLAKNFYLSPERTLSRKLNEIIMAMLLELHYSKAEILEAYLNEIFLGQEGQRAIHGFGLASYFYFGRPLNELSSPQQFALLVGLVRGASYLDPRRHAERATAQRNRILEVAAAAGDISTQDAASAKAAPLGVTDKIPSGTSPYPAFMDLVRRQLQTDYKEADLTSDGLQIFTTLDPRIQASTEQAIARQGGQLEKQFKIPSPLLEAAAVVTSSVNGEILAMVGGRDARYPGFNRALDSQRPIGSLIKPAVYLTALAQPERYTLATLLEDTPFSVPNPGSTSWKPQNYDHKSHGLVPLHSALAHSYNLSSARLGLDVGIPNVLATLQELGVDRKFSAYPSVLLGALDMSPLEVTQYYQTLASGGFKVPLRTIRDVLNARGEPLQRYSLSIKQAFDAGSIYLLTSAMQEVITQGTAQAVRKQLPDGLKVAGKTGTSDDLRDSWFAGFSGQHLAVVWVGRDDNKPTGLSGATGALKVWGDIMGATSTQSLELAQPANVEILNIDKHDNLLADSDCRSSIQLPFISGSGPADYSSCGGSYASETESETEAAQPYEFPGQQRNLQEERKPRENTRPGGSTNPFNWLKRFF